MFSVRNVAIVLGVVMLAGPFVAWKAYQRYDHEVHVYIESRPPLRDLRDLVRLWPWPSEYLRCREATPSPLPRFEAPAFIIGGKLYTFGGFTTPGLTAITRCDRYDPQADVWEPLADLPEPVTHAAAALDGTDVWLAGGFVGDHPGEATASVWKYDAVRDEWVAGVPLPKPRAAGGLALLSGKLHFFGGSEDDRSTDSGDHWVMDIAADEPAWEPAAPMPFRRHHFGTAVLDGKIHAIGGQRHHDFAGFGMRAQIDTDRVDVYEPQTDAWSDGVPLPRPRAHFEPGTFVWKERICIAGGEGGFTQALYNIHCYDPTEKSWIEMPGLPEPLRAPIVKPLDDRWFVGTGGVMPSGGRPGAQVWMCREPSG
jgi:hypothetical protein